VISRDPFGQGYYLGNIACEIQGWLLYLDELGNHPPYSLL